MSDEIKNPIRLITGLAPINDQDFPILEDKYILTSCLNEDTPDRVSDVLEEFVKQFNINNDLYVWDKNSTSNFEGSTYSIGSNITGNGGFVAIGSNLAVSSNSVMITVQDGGCCSNSVFLGYGPSELSESICVGRVKGAEGIEYSTIILQQDDYNAKYYSNAITIGRNIQGRPEYGYDYNIVNNTIGIGSDFTLPNTSIVIGQRISNNAQERAIIIGHDVYGIESDYSIILGHRAYAKNSSTVIGYEAHVECDAVAIGAYSYGYDGAVAIGQCASVNSSHGVSIGYCSATANDSVAIGAFSNGNSEGIAIGAYAIANNGAVAIGMCANTSDYSVAIGHYANVVGSVGIAIGPNSWANNGITIGYETYLDGYGNIVFGKYIWDTNTTNNTVLIGQHINACNCGNSIILGSGTIAPAGGPTEYMSNSLIIGLGTELIECYGNECLMIGNNLDEQGDNLIVIGTNSSVQDNSIAIGTNVHQYGQRAISIGQEINTDPESIAIGYDISVPNSKNICIGYNINTNGSPYIPEQVAIGSNITLRDGLLIQIGGAEDAYDTTYYAQFGDGSIYIQNPTNTASDERIKKNIKHINNKECLNHIMNIPVKSFDYKDFSGLQKQHVDFGFIAQDIEKILPSIINTQSSREFYYKDGEERISTTIEQFKGYDSTKLVPILWGAIQYLYTELEQLKK